MYSKLKRPMDFAVALLALLVLWPLLVAAAIAIVLESPGGFLFVQPRVGLHGRPFKLYKLRSMVADASAVGPLRTDRGDPRVTRVGAWLRRSSIDELPQLINVLKGDMSLIGPRPDVPVQRADYASNDWYARHSVRPGLTGLAQATARSTATPAERTRLDLEYVRNVSLALDLRIVGKTVAQVLGIGGY
jgi:lipopolysaccharide/colanic/teichoic acid biosynthesis glycosyltransferase